MSGEKPAFFRRRIGLLRLIRQNIARAPRPFALSVFGITLGIAALSFFLALSLGMQERVLRRIFPADRLEVVPQKTSFDSGAAGAPKAGDKGAWGPRLGAGLDGLAKSAAAGKGAMPPKGGAADLTDDELKRAVAFLANKAGASFKAPE